MTEQTVTVGRVVHVVAEGGSHCAAIVTEVLDGGPGIGVDSISVCVFHPSGLAFLEAVAEDASGTQPGTWHWPERGGGR